MSEIDRSLIGTETAPFTAEVERGAIRRFAEAIGDTLHRVLRAPFPAAPSRGARPARRAMAAA